jgi:S1-C subfamily serine protease
VFGAGRLAAVPERAAAGGVPTGPGRARASAQELSAAFQELSGSAGRSVVSVRADVRRRTGQFRRLAQGSGVIVRGDGLVVTNNHVIQGADQVTAALWDGTRVGARVLGRDPEADLALLEIEGGPYATLPFAEPEDVQVGEWVLALGNPLGYGPAVTAGIVSATGRADINITTYEDFVQTDAAINPGNSGGALVDLDGHLVGINTAMGTGAGGNLGIGFAIPAHMVREIVAELLEDGRVRRGWLGIEMDDLTLEEVRGMGFDGRSRVAVGNVLPDSPAEAAGLREGDVVLAIHGTPVERTRDLLNAIAQIEPGTRATVELWRAGEELRVEVELAERSAELLGRQPER